MYSRKPEVPRQSTVPHTDENPTFHAVIMLEEYNVGLITPQSDDSLPDLCVHPSLDNYVGCFLDVKHCTLDLKEAKGNAFNKMMVPCLNNC